MANLVSVTQIHPDSSTSRPNWSKPHYHPIHFWYVLCMSLKYDPEKTGLNMTMTHQLWPLLKKTPSNIPKVPFPLSALMLYVLAHFCQFDAMLDLPRKREAQLRNYFCQIGLRTGLWGYFIERSCCRKSQATVGGATPRTGGLGLYRKGRWTSQGKQAIKPHSSMISSLVPA